MANPSTSTAPSRPALRYHGGKWKLAKWIISHFPNHTCYCEPYGGGASVLLRKTPAPTEAYNDLSQDCVTFFRVLRERPAELIAAIDLTPYARAELIQAQEHSNDELEQARRFYTWSWQGRGRAGTAEACGWRFQSRMTRHKTPVDDWNNYNHLWAVTRRMKLVHIECDRALKVIKRWDTPETLFYLDPPYLPSTRSARWAVTAYTHELTDDDHQELAAVLHSIQGMAILSGYPSDLYNELYNDWHTAQRRAAVDNGAKPSTERLWMNYDPPHRQTTYLPEH